MGRTGKGTGRSPLQPSLRYVIVVDVVIFSIRLLEKYSAGMGRNNPHHVRLVRQCLGRQSRSRVGSLCRYHPSGRRIIDLPTQIYPCPSDHPFCNWRCRYFAPPWILILIFATCSLGFGRRVTWTSDLIVPPGHQMTFKNALNVSSANLFLKLVIPSWAMSLTEHTREINVAFKELKVPCPN